MLVFIQKGCRITHAGGSSAKAIATAVVPDQSYLNYSKNIVRYGW
jgi:hypothetical protein